MMTVGILYPSSNAHVDIGVDFIDGIKAFFEKEMPDSPIKLLIEGIGFGGSEKEVYQKAEKLIRIEKVDVLVAFIDYKVLAILEPLIFSTGSLLLVVNAGANYPSNWISQPNIIHLTLQHAFLNRLSGKLAGESASGNNNAALATTFFDCGYLHNAAIINGFMQKQGTLTRNYINRGAYDESFNIGELIHFLSANPDTTKLLCTFDSLPAALFYKRLNTYKDANKLQLFVSPMMLEKKALDGMIDGASFSVQGHMPWQTSLENEYNKYFIECFEVYAKKEVSMFALLGWEAGLVMQQIFQWDFYRQGTELVEQLKKVTLNSPRGPMKLHDETHWFLSPANYCSVANGEINTQIINNETIERQWAEFISIEADSMSSGWMNTYLCY